MTKLAEIATQHGGQTEKLKKGLKPYEQRTVPEICEEIVVRINATIEALKAGEKVAPMCKPVRHGIVIKIGYGKNNECIEGSEPEYFWDGDGDPIAYLEGARELIEAGEFDQELEAKRQELVERARKAREGKLKKAQDTEQEQSMPIAA